MIACNAAETLERDTFKSASEARDFGLIDEVIDKRPLDQPVAKSPQCIGYGFALNEIKGAGYPGRELPMTLEKLDQPLIGKEKQYI
ncbi:MAG: hypothetical protein FRX49_06530 [Trebouxia sp. A1-2]|nr:MAG: hypothetical protein FRX49_06530 [Trebouxia sp. A1-2]